MNYLREFIDHNPRSYLDILIDIQGKNVVVEGVVDEVSDEGLTLLVLTDEGMSPILLPDEIVLGFRPIID